MATGARGLLRHLQFVKVKDVIEKSRAALVRVQSSETVFSVVQPLRQSQAGAVLVTEGPDSWAKAPTGIFTERDLCDLYLRGVDLRTTLVGNEMSKNVVTGAPEMGIVDAIKMMLDNNISHLPIAEFVGDAIDEDTRITHILTSNDILSFFVTSDKQ